ncbi:MAG: IclR family transcriptional regulator [Rhodococcus sp. (in: high G+C Gram-positive bacteria)]
MKSRSDSGEPPSDASTIAGTSMISRAFSILDAFTGVEKSVRLSDVADRTGLARPTALRILGQLAGEGVVVREGARYRLGARLWHLGMSAAVQRDLRDVAAPFLQDLHAATRATVHLAIRQADEVLYLDRLAGSASVPVVSRVGGTLPLHSTGVGKVLLAHAPDDTRERVLAALTRSTAYTLTNRALLNDQLVQVRRRGYATTSEEMTLGACSVAVPIGTGDGPKVVAALGIVVPRVGRDVVRYVSAMQVAARGITRSLAQHESE